MPRPRFSLGIILCLLFLVAYLASPSYLQILNTDFSPSELPSFTCDRCTSDPSRCEIYGSRNVDLSRAFEGTGRRVQTFLKKIQSGQPVTVGALGGSVSLGAGCHCSPWHAQVFSWLNQSFPHPDHQYVSGAVGARGSDYFKFCASVHIPTSADLVVMEMSVNDFRMGDPAHENFESLLRAVLSYPSKPAVIILQTFKIDGIMATGGDNQLGTAGYYDVPVISTRNWVLPMLMNDESKIPEFFNYYVYEHGSNPPKIVEGRKDLLHPSAKGHEMMADSIIMYLSQQLCFLDHARPIEPALNLTWMPQIETYNDIPRMRLNRQFETNFVEPDLKPKCASLDSAHSPLVPVASLTHGWELWEMPGTNGKKKYWRGREPGAEIVFEVEIVTGDVNLYYLKSAKTDLALGLMDCWLDDDRKHSTELNGWWANTESVGHYGALEHPHVEPGIHHVHCRILEKTKNPNPKAHDFLLIGVFSV